MARLADAHIVRICVPGHGNVNEPEHAPRVRRHHFVIGSATADWGRLGLDPPRSSVSGASVRTYAVWTGAMGVLDASAARLERTPRMVATSAWIAPALAGLLHQDKVTAPFDDDALKRSGPVFPGFTRRSAQAWA